MSRAVKAADRSRAHDFLAAAADKYATSLRWNPNNPQVSAAPMHEKMRLEKRTQMVTRDRIASMCSLKTRRGSL